MRVNIIGAGRLGQTLAKLITLYKVGTIQAVYNQTVSSAQHAITFIGQGLPCHNMEALPPAEVTLITTPDDLISDISQQLAATDKNPISNTSNGQLVDQTERWMRD